MNANSMKDVKSKMQCTCVSSLSNLICDFMCYYLISGIFNWEKFSRWMI